MVKKWEKSLKLIERVIWIDLDAIIDDIYDDKLEKYDMKKLQGKQNLYRIRIEKYRIIFEKREGQNIIVNLWNRWDVYKKI